MQLSGVIVPVGTPLTGADRVDEPGLRRLTRYLLAARVHGLFANGSMSGFAFLTDEEQLRAVATIVSEVNGAVPVMGGVGETSTSRAVQKARAIAREGVTHLTVLPPFYFLATQEHLTAYFSEIASAVDLPLFLYDNPVLTKCSLLPETVDALRRRIPNIVGIKVSDQDCANLQNLLHLTRDGSGFSVLTGSEFLILVALQMGCDGCVGGLHNICPQIAVDLYEAYRAGDVARAQKRQRELIEAWQIFRYGAIWGAFDEALRYLGLCDRATGAPYVTALNRDEQATVRSILDRWVKPWLMDRATT